MTDQPATAANPSAASALTAPPRDGAIALSVLHEILLALAHGESQEQALQLIADKARLLTRSASTAVALLDSSSGGDHEFVAFAAVSGEEARDVAGTRVLAADTITGHTARTGEPYLAFRPAGTGRNTGGGSSGAAVDIPAVVESAAVVPIFAEGQPVGALAALNKADDLPFGGDDLLCLSTLAAAASVVIASTRLRGEAQRQGRELSILYDAVRNVSGPLTAQEVLRAVVEQVSAHLDCGAVAVFLTNDERTHLYIAADRGLSDDQREVTLTTDSGLGAAAFASPRPVFLTFTDPEEDEEAAGGGGISRDATASKRGEAPSRAGRAFEPPFPDLKAPRSALAAPIRSGDVTHGLVLVIGEQSAAAGQGASAYSLTDANLLSALASQAAVAMENAWLYEDATRRAEEAAALYELSQAVTSTLRQEDVLERVADSILALLMVDKFALFLREPDTDRLKMVVARGLPAGAAERIRPAAGQGIPGWVMEFETPTAVQDVAADHRNASCPLHPEGVVSLMAVPLQVGASTIGALCAMSARRRLFTVAEMELLYTIANQAAIAIENARMYADARQKSLEQRRYFHRIARVLGSSQSPGEVPQLIASLMLEVMGADRCALYSLAKPGDSDSRFLRMEARAGYRLAGESDEGGSGSNTAGAAAQIPVNEETPTGWVARRTRSLPVEDIADDPRFLSGTGRPARGRPAISYLGVPLRSGEEIVGVLEVYTRARRRWRADEVRLLHTFASQAVVAFQNARLARESRRTARRAGLLQHLLEMALRQRSDSSPTIDPAALVHTIADGLGSSAALLERAPDSAAAAEPPWVCRAASADLSPKEAVTLLLSAPTHPSMTFVTSPQGERVFMVIRGESGENGQGGDSDGAGEEDATIRVILEAAMALLLDRERG